MPVEPCFSNTCVLIYFKALSCSSLRSDSFVILKSLFPGLYSIKSLVDALFSASSASALVGTTIYPFSLISSDFAISSSGAMSLLLNAISIGLLIFLIYLERSRISSSVHLDGLSVSIFNFLMAAYICSSLIPRPVSFSASTLSIFFPSSSHFRAIVSQLFLIIPFSQ